MENLNHLISSRIVFICLVSSIYHSKSHHHRSSFSMKEPSRSKPCLVVLKAKASSGMEVKVGIGGLYLSGAYETTNNDDEDDDDDQWISSPLPESAPTAATTLDWMVHGIIIIISSLLGTRRPADSLVRSGGAMGGFTIKKNFLNERQMRWRYRNFSIQVAIQFISIPLLLRLRVLVFIFIIISCVSPRSDLWMVNRSMGWGDHHSQSRPQQTEWTDSACCWGLQKHQAAADGGIRWFKLTWHHFLPDSGNFCSGIYRIFYRA